MRAGPTWARSPQPEFAHAPVALPAQQVRGGAGRHDVAGAAFERTQTGQVEVVHVGVRKQHQVHGWQAVQGQSGFHEALVAEREQAQIQPDPGAEDRVGDDGIAVHLQQCGGMAQPAGMQAPIGPAARVGVCRSGRHRMANFLCVTAPEGRARRGRAGRLQRPPRRAPGHPARFDEGCRRAMAQTLRRSSRQGSPCMW